MKAIGPKRAATVVLAVAALCVPATASAANDCRAGAAGVGDRYFPGYGNGGYDVTGYDLEIAYDPADDTLRGRTKVRARAEQNLCSVNLDLLGFDVRASQGPRPQGGVEPRRPGAHDHAEGPPREGLPFLPDRALQRDPGGSEGSLLQPADGVHADQRRRERRRTARIRRELVPGQRPPERQGELLVRRRRPGRLRGGRQRPVPRHRERRGGLDPLALGGRRADGSVPDDDRHRAVGREPLANGRRAAGLRRGRPGDHRGAPAGGRLLARQAGRDPGAAQQQLRPRVPVRHRRRHRRPGAADRVRARDADATRLLLDLLARRQRGTDERRLRRGPRARPPVVRRRHRPEPLARHLAERGVRDLRRVPLDRAQRRTRPAAVLRGRAGGLSRRRSALVDQDRRSGRRPPLRPGRLPPRCADASGAPQRGRRRHVLGRDPSLGQVPRRGPRHDRPVHRARREGFGKAARRPLRRCGSSPRRSRRSRRRRARPARGPTQRSTSGSASSATATRRVAR